MQTILENNCGKFRNKILSHLRKSYSFHRSAVFRRTLYREYCSHAQYCYYRKRAILTDVSASTESVTERHNEPTNYLRESVWWRSRDRVTTVVWRRYILMCMRARDWPVAETVGAHMLLVAEMYARYCCYCHHMLRLFTDPRDNAWETVDRMLHDGVSRSATVPGLLQ